MESDEFLQIGEAWMIYERARSLLRRMCGIINIYGNYVGEIQVAGVEWTDATGRRGGLGRPATFTGHVYSPEKIEELAGAFETGETLGSRLLRSSENTPELRALLDLVGWEPLNWVDAYKVFELLREAAGGLDSLAAATHTSKKELRLFKNTANWNRHASVRSEPPMRPMTFQRAQVLIRDLAKEWLDRSA